MISSMSTASNFLRVTSISITFLLLIELSNHCLRRLKVNLLHNYIQPNNMPEAFMRCVKDGGKVFTVEAGRHHYVHGCKPKGGGKAVYGERKKKKESEQKNK